MPDAEIHIAGQHRCDAQEHGQRLAGTDFHKRIKFARTGCLTLPSRKLTVTHFLVSFRAESAERRIPALRSKSEQGTDQLTMTHAARDGGGLASCNRTPQLSRRISTGTV